jgi:hypothetical protein
MIKTVSKHQGPIWGVLAVVAFIALFVSLFWFVRELTRPPKARAQRIAGVNSLRTVTLVITNANALPALQQSPAK